MRSATRFANGAVGILIVTMAMVANADTFYVNGTCGNDAWTGTNSVCSAPNGPKLTIQASMSASITGDTVVVADGTYIGADNKNLDFGGRLITLRSENGAVACIIDCENDGRAFRFHSGETVESVLDGFTIQNAIASAIVCESASPTIMNCVLTDNQSSRGGGMTNLGSDPTVTNCTFSGNTVVQGGGGMYNSGSNPTVTDCTFIGNSASWGAGSFGGGMLNVESDPTVTNCTFSGNSTEGDGGGMWNLFSSPTLTNCRFTGNVSLGSPFSSGGGMAGEVSSPTVTHCTFTGNLAGDRGGGMFDWEGSATLTNCSFSGNSAVSGGAMYNSGNGNATVNNCTFSENSSEDDGGGMVNANGTPTVTNCTFSGNSAGGDGGGMYNASRARVTNCTFSANSAEGDGGGMYNANAHSRPTVSNCIFWNDIPNEVVDSLGPPSTLRFSDVQGGWKGQGNIDVDPLFVDPANDDYRLAPGSPCIDAADNTAVPPGITTDLAGNPRFVDDPATPDTGVPGGAGGPDIVDMGAYEFPCDPCDMNCDGTVDASDIEFFTDILFNGAAPCDPCTGDTNGDGSVDAADIEGFINCLFP